MCDWLDFSYIIWSLLLSWWYFLTLCARKNLRLVDQGQVKGTLVQGKGKFLRRPLGQLATCVPIEVCVLHLSTNAKILGLPDIARQYSTKSWNIELLICLWPQTSGGSSCFLKAFAAEWRECDDGLALDAFDHSHLPISHSTAMTMANVPLQL